MTHFIKHGLFIILPMLLSAAAIAQGNTTNNTANTITSTTVSAHNPTVVIHTNKGPITVELYASKAPVTVTNFLDYAKTGFYNGTIFHRVIKRFMIQGGGFTKEMKKKETKAAIINESGNGLYNERWTLAMARTDDPNSATAQFFINAKMNTNLDAGRGKAGYAVFGRVIDGQYVVKTIEKTVTTTVTTKTGTYFNVPAEPIIIERMEIK